jgi:hypothetical protein
MRYFLALAGMLATALGFFMAVEQGGPTHPSGDTILLAGVIAMAVGIAAIDVVEALAVRRNRALRSLTSGRDGISTPW